MTVGDGEGGKKKQCDISETDKPRRHGEDERTNEKTDEKQAEAQRGRVCCDYPPNNRFFILGGILRLSTSPSLHHHHAV